MAQTKALLRTQLPDAIAGIVLLYFKSQHRFGFNMALAGEYEECITTIYVNTSLRGACIGGWPEIVKLMIARGADDFSGAYCHTMNSGADQAIVAMLEPITVGMGFLWPPPGYTCVYNTTPGFSRYRWTLTHLSEVAQTESSIISVNWPGIKP